MLCQVFSTPSLACLSHQAKLLGQGLEVESFDAGRNRRWSSLVAVCSWNLNFSGWRRAKKKSVPGVCLEKAEVFTWARTSSSWTKETSTSSMLKSFLEVNLSKAIFLVRSHFWDLSALALHRSSQNRPPQHQHLIRWLRIPTLWGTKQPIALFSAQKKGSEKPEQRKEAKPFL